MQGGAFYHDQPVADHGNPFGWALGSALYEFGRDAVGQAYESHPVRLAYRGLTSKFVRDFAENPVGTSILAEKLSNWWNGHSFRRTSLPAMAFRRGGYRRRRGFGGSRYGRVRRFRRRSYGGRRRFRRSFGRRRGYRPHLRVKRMGYRTPFGDIAMVKFKSVYSGQFNVASGTNQSQSLRVWNSLLSADFPYSGWSRPEGYDVWLSLYQHYEVYGIKIIFTSENLGIYSDAVSPLGGQPVASPTGYIGLSAEGHNDASSDPMNQTSYWTEQNLRLQRWATVKNIGTRDSGHGIKTVKHYYSTKQWTQNRTEKNINFGTITYSGPGVGAGTPGAPATLYRWGYVHGYSMDLATIPALHTGKFTDDIKVILYVKFWNKRPNFSIGQ